MNDTATIYALRDPRTNELRYIGMTITSLAERLGKHLRDKRRTRRNSWIKSLGIKPVIEPLMYVPRQLAAAAEIYTIAIYRSTGYRLVNHTDGGEGTFGHRHSIETKAKMRAAVPDRSGSKNPFYGRTHSEITRAKIRAARGVQTFSAETRAKIGAASKRLGTLKAVQPLGVQKRAELMRARTHCKRGHEYVVENLNPKVFKERGWRACLICHRQAVRNDYLRRKARKEKAV